VNAPPPPLLDPVRDLRAPPLLDPVRDVRARPLRDLRISVTDRCNFRCTYCMPEELFGERYRFLPKPEILSFEEIERVTRLFVQAGVRKLRITGGEPLLRQDLPSLIARLAAIPGVEDLALTTNGTLLPRLAQPLRDAGLRRITVSLDSLDPAVFHAMNGGRLSVEGVLAGIEAADAAGLGPVKINCVVQRGVNDHTLIEMAKRNQVDLDRLQMIYLACSAEERDQCRCAWPYPSQIDVGEKVEGIADALHVGGGAHPYRELP